jgi:hypothetical protein
MRFSTISILLLAAGISAAQSIAAPAPTTSVDVKGAQNGDHHGDHHGDHSKGQHHDEKDRNEARDPAQKGETPHKDGKHHKGNHGEKDRNEARNPAHKGEKPHNGHGDKDRHHARDFTLSERSSKSKVETVELPLNIVNTTTTASFQASGVKDGGVIFVWVNEKPETLVGAHLASSDIADGMTKIKSAANGKTVDRIVVQVPKSSQGDKDFDAITDAFNGWTKTKPQHREFKDGNTYAFWATAGKKGEIGMKSD